MSFQSYQVAPLLPPGPPPPGVTAFITGQAAAGSSAESNDVDGGPTTLLSPNVNLATAGAARVGFRRWVSNNAGSFSGGRLLAQTQQMLWVAAVRGA